ncbi:MAG: DUF2809 domain-containing protein [Clostridium sp.]
MKRNRVVYFILIFIVMIMGVCSRRYGQYLPVFISTYGGDTLWALMVFWGFAFLFNCLSVKKIALMAVIFSYGIEISQRYQAVWINEIRATTIGALILGHGFLFSDLICYSVGIIMGMAIDFMINKNKVHK